jgi:hypothetical protein
MRHDCYHGSFLTRLHDVMFSGTACGFGRDDDAAVVKVQLCFSWLLDRLYSSVAHFTFSFLVMQS